jgi:serine/threonine protein kinase
MLGDEIGKGAYGRVYKGLDLENGDFVAIKQVSLENIPQEDLNIIMVRIPFLLVLPSQLTCSVLRVTVT